MNGSKAGRNGPAAAASNAPAGGADARIRRAIAQWDAARAAGGRQHPAALKARHRLAHALRAAGRFDDALLHFAAIARDAAVALGGSHRETLRCRSSLANCHYAAGNTDVAIQMFGAILAARQAALGDNHPDTLRSRGSLANALYSAGRVAEAAVLHRRNAGARTASDRTAAQGAEHPATRASRRNLERAAATAGAEKPPDLPPAAPGNAALPADLEFC